MSKSFNSHNSNSLDLHFIYYVTSYFILFKKLTAIFTIWSYMTHFALHKEVVESQNAFCILRTNVIAVVICPGNRQMATLVF